MSTTLPPRTTIEIDHLETTYAADALVVSGASADEPQTELPERPKMGLAAMAAATPASRDRVVDLLRAVAMVAVVLGHFLVAVPTLVDGELSGENIIGISLLAQSFTWIFQVMPLFFVLGGVANAASLRAAERDGVPTGTWLQGRLQRLLGPTMVFLGFWTIGAAAARLFGVSADLTSVAAHVAVIPLWFLSTYVIVTALAPLGLRLHDRSPLLPVVVLAALTVIVDIGRFNFGWGALAMTNFIFAFGFAQQLGFWWRDGMLASRRSAALILALGGLAATLALVTFGPYPFSMVGGPGDVDANNGPPTLALSTLGLFHLGLARLAAPLLARLAQHPKVWMTVIAANARIMTLYLWHFTALIIGAVALVATSIFPQSDTASLTWWALRLPWLAVLFVVLGAITAAAGRYERPNTKVDPTDNTHRGRQLAQRSFLAVPPLAVAFFLIATNGLNSGSAPLGLPVPALLCLGAGWLLVQPRRQVG